MIPWVNARILAVYLSFFVASAFAQSNPPVVTDQTLGGTGGQFENIEQSNGGVNLSIHLLKVRSRGIDFDYNLSYTSKIWYVTSIPGGSPGTIQYVWTYKSPWTAFGTGDAPTSVGGPVAIDQCLDQLDHPQNIRVIPNELVTYPDGSQKTFPLLAFYLLPNCKNPPQTAEYGGTYSSDLSAVTISGIYRDGSTFNRDTNGNSVAVSGDPSTPELFHYTDSVRQGSPRRSEIDQRLSDDAHARGWAHHYSDLDHDFCHH